LPKWGNEEGPRQRTIISGLSEHSESSLLILSVLVIAEIISVIPEETERLCSSSGPREDIEESSSSFVHSVFFGIQFNLFKKSGPFSFNDGCDF